VAKATLPVRAIARRGVATASAKQERTHITVPVIVGCQVNKPKDNDWDLTLV
jgi:hypothetical protein